MVNVNMCQACYDWNRERGGFIGANEYFIDAANCVNLNNPEMHFRGKDEPAKRREKVNICILCYTFRKDTGWLDYATNQYVLVDPETCGSPGRQGHDVLNKIGDKELVEFTRPGQFGTVRLEMRPAGPTATPWMTYQEIDDDALGTVEKELEKDVPLRVDAADERGDYMATKVVNAELCRHDRTRAECQTCYDASTVTADHDYRDNLFIEAMQRCGFALAHIAGTVGTYSGPAVQIEGATQLQDVIRATDMRLQWAKFGPNLFVYPYPDWKPR